MEDNAFTAVVPLRLSDSLHDELAQRIREFFSAALNVKTEEIADQADFFLDLGGSSLDYFGMISAIENEFSVKIPVEKSAELSTVAAFHRYLSETL